MALNTRCEKCRALLGPEDANSRPGQPDICWNCKRRDGHIDHAALAQEELVSLIDVATRIEKQVKLSGEPMHLSDARLLRSKAQWLEALVERAHVDTLRTQQPRTPEQDKAAQTAERWNRLAMPHLVKP